MAFCVPQNPLVLGTNQQKPNVCGPWCLLKGIGEVVMAKLLADKRVAMLILDKAPTDPDNLVVADFADASNESCHVFFNGTFLRATGSATVTEPMLCGDGKEAFGSSNYEGALVVARFLDPATGLPVEGEDALWPKVKEKGTKLYVAWRVGPVHNAQVAAEQEISVFEVTTDTPQEPQTYSDYVKVTIPLAVANAWMYRTVGAGS